MTKTKNTFIELMDQDTSKSKYKNTKIYKGVNIKVLTEEGLSSGAIENEGILLVNCKEAKIWERSIT